jgi:hypothetical protein
LTGSLILTLVDPAVEVTRGTDDECTGDEGDELKWNDAEGEAGTDDEGVVDRGVPDRELVFDDGRDERPPDDDDAEADEDDLGV